MTQSPYLSGNFAPVAEERTELDLAVTGTIPEELEGRLLRIGPNPVGPVGEKHHWFLGNGMVHGVRLRGGRAEWYRNRWVRDDEVVAVRGGPEVPGPRRDDAPVGVVNTNVIGHAGRTFAIVEAGSLPMELSHELETVSRCDFDGTLPAGFTAHPKRDPVSGELHAAVYSPFWDHVQYLVVGSDARVRRTLDVPVSGKPMVHDCAITERYFLIFDLPVTFTPEMVEQGHVLPYRWNPEHGARVGLVPRKGGAEEVVWCEVEPCYVFHPMNAHDTDDGRVVVDVIRHPSMFATDMRGPNEGAPTLDRWTLDPRSGRAREQRLDEAGQEFPRHDDRLVGRPYRYGYTVQFGGEELAFGGLYKHDFRDGKVEVHDEGPARSFMEAVFVPRTPDAAEDDGWVLAYCHDASTRRGDVVILHAQDFSGGPVAVVHLPARVPYGFHGNWVPDPD